MASVAPLLPLLLLATTLAPSRAHVALTYPPARKYDHDFLDNVRTKGPCGMPKGRKIANLQGVPKYAFPF